MAVYFIPKNHLITKAANLRSLPNKWSIKWTTNAVRRNISNKSCQQQQQHQQHVKSCGGETTRKGKLSQLKSLRLTWSWKAGASWTIISVLDWWLLAAGWFTWSGLLTRWTPIGVCMFAALEWHYHTNKLEKQGLPITASNLQMNAYCSLPLRLLSRCWGWVASCKIPESFRPFVYGSYAKVYNVNMDEAEYPDFKHYGSLAEFFTRSLRGNVRPIANSCITSPADGRILHFGSATESRIEQVKGVSYTMESFLGPATWANGSNGDHKSYADTIKQNKNSALYQCVIYLAPGDYHRFHSPANWEPEFRRHFTGQLLSVSPKVAEWLPGLFCLNERALYTGKWDNGFFSLTAVGATNVGSVQIYFDETLKTNKFVMGPVKRCACEEKKLSEKVRLEKGELLGQFNMGSTIVLIFEAPLDFKFTIEAGQTIKYGEKLGDIIGKDI